MRAYRIAHIVPLLLGIFFLVQSYRLSLGELTEPGPGLWPFIASILIVGSSIVLMVAERDSEAYERFTSRIKLVGLGLVSLVAFVLLFEQLGFILPGFLTIVFWLKFLGAESWRLTLSVSTLCTAGLYILFVPLLGVPFPDDLVASLWE